MTDTNTLIRWLEKQGADCDIWIDEGGLTLESATGDYLAVGGKPLLEEGEDQ